SSVDRLQEDLAADAAGRPKKLKGTGRILERSGISVAPPEHVHSSGATIPPRPTRMVSSRIRIDPEAADQGKNEDIALGVEDKNSESAATEENSLTDASTENDISDNPIPKDNSAPESASETADNIMNPIPKDDTSALPKDVDMGFVESETPRKVTVRDDEPTPRQENLKRARALSSLTMEDVPKISRLTLEHESVHSASVSGAESIPSRSISPSQDNSSDSDSSSSGLQGASRIVGGFSEYITLPLVWAKVQMDSTWNKSNS
ncbi:hypothetical protein H0H92_013287, partial [Tricholoma furcatifolium]